MSVWNLVKLWCLTHKLLCTFHASIVFNITLTKLLIEMTLLILNADISASTQQANELPCNGSIAFKHSLLQTLLSILFFQCVGWPWQRRCAISNFLYLFVSHFCICSLWLHLQPKIGKGCVFTYDAVGSYERVGYSSQGSGSTLIMPFLDNQLKSPSPLLLPAQVKFLNWCFSLSIWCFKLFLNNTSTLKYDLLQDAVTPLSEAEAVDLVKTVFASATERDIYTVSLFTYENGSSNLNQMIHVLT